MLPQEDVAKVIGCVIAVGEGAIELVRTALGVQTITHNIAIIGKETEEPQPNGDAGGDTPSQAKTIRISREEAERENDVIYWEGLLAKGNRDFVVLNNKFRASHSQLLMAIAASVRGALHIV